MTEHRDVGAGGSQRRVLRERAQVVALPGGAHDRREAVAVALEDTQHRRELRLPHQQPLVLDAGIDDLELGVTVLAPADLHHLLDGVADVEDEPLATGEAAGHLEVRIDEASERVDRRHPRCPCDPWRCHR